jgi:hypothetical protein
MGHHGQSKVRDRFDSGRFREVLGGRRGLGAESDSTLPSDMLIKKFRR